MLTGVFHLHEQEARQVMTPIPAVVTVDIVRGRRDGAAPLRLLAATRGWSSPRTTTATACAGIVHSNALAQPLMADGPARDDRRRSCARRRSCPRPSRSTTCSPTCSASAPRWRSSSTSTAASSGIVTVEDIIEEVVGEIDDETDPPGGEVRRLANGDWFVRGHVAITDLARLRPRAAGRHRRLQLGRRLRLRRARAAAQARRHGHRQRLLDPRRVGAREPHRGRAHPRAPRPAGRGRPAANSATASTRRAKAQVLRARARWRLLERAPERGRTDRGSAASRSWDSDAATVSRRMGPGWVHPLRFRDRTAA